MRSSIRVILCPSWIKSSETSVRSDYPSLLTVLQIDVSRAATPCEAGLDARDHRRLSVFLRRLSLLDHEVDATERGNLAEHAIFGFWSPERDGTWMAGLRAALVFEFTGAHLPSHVRLAIDAHPFREAFNSCELRFRTSAGHRGRLTVTGDGPLETTLRRPFWIPRTRLITGDLTRLRTRQNVSLSSECPLVSIIIPYRDRPLLTRLATCACASSKIRVPFEVVCVDDGSSDDTRSVMSRAEVPRREVFLDDSLGFAEACNAGANEARGDYLLFLNNDAFLQPDAVQEMLHTFQTHSDCGAVGAVLLNTDDSVQEAGCSLQADGFPVRHGRDDPNFDLQKLPLSQPVDYVSGACLMVRRDDFLAMGGFHPKYSPAYYEDTDFCLRLLTRGKRTYVASRARCYHIENATSGDIENGAWATRTSEAHRQIFLQDWAPYLASRNPADFPRL